MHKLCDRCQDNYAAVYMWQNLPIMLLHVCDSCATLDKNLCKTAEELLVRKVTRNLLHA